MLEQLTQIINSIKTRIAEVEQIIEDCKQCKSPISQKYLEATARKLLNNISSNSCETPIDKTLE
jgi:hypothetical protein